MRLVGYIRELIENSFSVPIYSDKGRFYCHSIDDEFRITKFNEICLNKDYFIECNTYKDFKIDDYGALVFIGFNNTIFLDNANLIIDRIEKYINETTKENKYTLTKNEIIELKSKFFDKDLTFQIGKTTKFAKVLSTINDAKFPITTNIKNQSNNVWNFGYFQFDKIEDELVIHTISPSITNFTPHLLKKEFKLNHDISGLNKSDLDDFIELRKISNYKAITEKNELLLLNIIFNEYSSFFNYMQSSSLMTRRFKKFILNELELILNKFEGKKLNQGEIFYGKIELKSYQPPNFSTKKKK